MYRSLFAAFAVTALLAAPAFAQVDATILSDARKLTTEAALSPEADKTLFCAAAFNIRALRLASTDKAGESAAEHERAANLLARADQLLTAKGLNADQRSKLTEAMSYIVMSQVVDEAGKVKYSRDECLALASGSGKD